MLTTFLFYIVALMAVLILLFIAGVAYVLCRYSDDEDDDYDEDVAWQ